MNKEYKDMLNELHFSEEQKENMVDRLMRAQLEPVQPHKRRRPIRRGSRGGSCGSSPDDGRGRCLYRTGK